MKPLLLLCAAILPAFAQQAPVQQGFDFKSLDKLGANAKSTTNVTLEGDSLKLATSALNDDDDAQIQSIVKHLKAIYVRNFEYAKPGQYKPADLIALRTYVDSLHWTKIIDVKEENNETTEVYLQPLPNNRLGGLAVISAEPTEVAVVFIQGDLDMSDIGKLSGNLGIPELGISHGGKSDNKSAPPKNNEKKDR